MDCPHCQSKAAKNGKTVYGKQKYRCASCGYNFERDVNEPVPVPIVSETTDKIIGLTEAQLRAKYDIRFIVATKCKELKSGVYLTKSEFIMFCGIRAGQGYTDIVNHPDYDAYRGKVGGQVYYSHPDSIRKLKSEGVLT